MNDVVKELFKVYKVKLRKENQTVRHQAYGFETVITPEQFAIYEIALKAMYIHLQYNHSQRKMYQQFFGTQIYYQSLCDPHDIELPYIPEKLKMEKAERGIQDYYKAVAYLKKENGTDAKTHETRNLYYALLD